MQVDEAGRAAGPHFDGSRAELAAHLMSDSSEPRPIFTDDFTAHVWLHPLTREFVGHAVVMKLPWGKWRWLANPPHADEL